MQYRIGHVSTKINKKETKPRHVCTICHVAFATHDNSRVVYVHVGTGDSIAICYEHLLDIANRPGTYFPRLPGKKLKDFDLIKYLNEVREVMADKLIDEKVLNTFTTITELMDKTGLSKYVGGTAEMFNIGFKDTKILAIETVSPQPQQQVIN